jgi:hypothetical protein
MWFPGLASRRSFLSVLAAWSGAGAILRPRVARGKDGIETVSSTPGRPLDRTSAAVFESQLGSAFQIVAAPGAAPQRVYLTTATRSQTIGLTNGKAAEPTPAFSLIFRGTAGPRLTQGIYRVEHPKLGVFPLFLVPIGPNQAEVCYEAVFA